MPGFANRAGSNHLRRRSRRLLWQRRLPGNVGLHLPGVVSSLGVDFLEDDHAPAQFLFGHKVRAIDLEKGRKLFFVALRSFREPLAGFIKGGLRA